MDQGEMVDEAVGGCRWIAGTPEEGRLHEGDSRTDRSLR